MSLPGLISQVQSALRHFFWGKSDVQNGIELKNIRRIQSFSIFTQRIIQGKTSFADRIDNMIRLADSDRQPEASDDFGYLNSLM